MPEIADRDVRMLAHASRTLQKEYDSRGGEGRKGGPFDVHCWALPKKVVMERWRSGAIASQHGGRGGRDTAWLHVVPGEEPAWLRPWGGGPAQAMEVIARLTGRLPG